MERLRFALLYDGARLERWHLRCLDELEHVAELVQVVVAEERAPRATVRLHSRLLRWYGLRLTRMASAPVADRFAPTPKRGMGSVDFVLKLGSVAVPTELVECARLGIWSFEHEAQGIELPFFAEVYAGVGVTRAALVETGQRELILEEGVFRTDVRSYAASRKRIEDAIATWPARVCRRLAAGTPHAAREAASVDPVPASQDAGLVRLAARLGIRRIRLAWQRLFRHPEWNIGLLHRPVESLLETAGYRDDEVEWFPLEGRAGFLADPFGVERDGRLHILCEYFDHRTGKGRICALDHSAEGFDRQPLDAVSLPVHMSYPYVLDLPEGVFCVPETAAACEIALYRANGPIRDWSKVAVLIPDVAGVDPTVFQHKGRWWLTCTRLGAQEDTELWVWHAPQLIGPWVEHALNPVKTDVRSARPGGRPFFHERNLYRPAQDCSTVYGGRITLQRVTHLSATEFVEETVATVQGSAQSRYPIGPHTLTPVADIVLVDGRRNVFVPAAFRAFLAIWARALTRRARPE